MRHTTAELIAQVRALDELRVKASRRGDRGMVQRMVYDLARLAPQLADHLQACGGRDTSDLMDT